MATTTTALIAMYVDVELSTAGGAYGLGVIELVVGAAVGVCVAEGVGGAVGAAVDGAVVGMTAGEGVALAVIYVDAVDPPYEFVPANVAMTWYNPGTGGVQLMPKLPYMSLVVVPMSW